MIAPRIRLTDHYEINRVIIGGWQLSDGHALLQQNDMSDARNAFARLLDEGFKTFDCADIYTGVEAFIGELVNERKKLIGTDDIQVHTKFVPDMDALKTIDKQYVERIITRSLQRLNKEQLNLVQFHWWDYDTPGYVETALHLLDLKNKGLIANIATTNFDTPHLQELLDAGVPVVSNQIQYSLMDHRPERQMVKLCEEHHVKLICYGSLAGGFLSEKWLGQPYTSRFENRSLVKYSLVIEDTLGWDGYQTLLGILKTMADHKGCTISNLATAYVLSKPCVAAAIVGTRNSRHIDSNKQLFSCKLTPEEVGQIEQFIASFPGLEGEPFELERLSGGKHREIMKMNLADV